MKISKIIRRRRAVSPILAAILLIGLAVAAGAVLFVVVLPLISAPGGTVVFDETTTELTNSTAKIVLKNEGTETATVTDIDISSSTETANFTFVQFTINTGAAQIKNYTFDEELSAGTYTITVSFTVGDTTDEISIDLTIE